MFDKSYASFRFLPEMYNNFGEEIQHINDINQNQNSYSQITIKHLYDSAFLSILTESDFESTIKVKLLSLLNNETDEIFEFRNDYLTEKTSRNLMMGLPFIMVGPYKSLDRLKNMGFKTFEMIIDESYDMEPDPLQRFEMIKNEIIKISKLSVDELRNINKLVVDLIKQKRTIESLEKKVGLQVGMKVKVNHPKLHGRELEVTKINRTKANLRVVGGFASYNVPVSLIEF